MRCLNEHLARRANEEDGCRGRFWEGRFKSQALLDEAAVLTCMSYVDLNPVRASIAEIPEASDFTSIQQRIQAYHATKQPTEKLTQPTNGIPLMPLLKQRKGAHPNAIGYTTRDYLELVDWAGRAVREHKNGVIPSDIPPILTRLGIEPSRYLEHMAGKGLLEQPLVIGRFDQIRQLAKQVGRCFIKGLGEARRLYRPLAV